MEYSSTGREHGKKGGGAERRIVLAAAPEADEARLEKIVAGLGQRFTVSVGGSGEGRYAIGVAEDLMIGEAARKVADALYEIDLDWPRVISFYEPAEF